MVVLRLDSSGEKGENKAMKTYQKYRCLICGYVYDEAEGDSESSIPEGTLWSDLPSDWVCPMCGVGPDEFELLD